MFIPSHLRDTDHNKLLLKIPSRMNRFELKKYNEMNALIEKTEEIPNDHPLIKEFEDQLARDKEVLEPERQKVLEKLERKRKKKISRLIMEEAEQGELELAEGKENDYLNVRQERKINREKHKNIEKKKAKNNRFQGF